MARAATGQVLENANGYSVRVRVGPKPEDRRAFALAVATADAAAERATLLADIAKRLRPLAAPGEIAELLTLAGNARNAKTLREVGEAVDAIESGGTSRASSAVTPTFAAFALEWTSGDLRKKYPDHVREKDAKRDVQILRDFVNPKIGTVRIADVKLEHVERVMSALPEGLAPASRRQVAQCMRKVLSFAVYPGKYLPINPLQREWMPKVRGATKAKSCLHPEEDAKLMACIEVPLERRIAYGVLAREGLRASELELLKWQDLDVERGRIRLDRNKTSDPRAWALSPDVTRTLAWWKKVRKGQPSDRVLSLDLSAGAWWLRGKTWDPKTRHKDSIGDLRTAGITRPELFERSKTRQPIRLHDLRATFVTVSLANGKTEQWVSDRTGHRSSQMLALYSRQARTWSELEMGTLQPLDELLPEVPKSTPGRGSAGTPPTGSEWASTPPTGSASADLGAESASINGTAENVPHGDPLLIRRSRVRVPLGPQNTAHSLPNGPDEVPERAAVLEAAIGRLTRALATASDDVIPDLVSERAAMRAELRALNEGAAGVVRLDDERGRRGR